MTTYSALLATARKRVHSPYSGPTPGELAAKVVLENLTELARPTYAFMSRVNCGVSMWYDAGA